MHLISYVIYGMSDVLCGMSYIGRICIVWDVLYAVYCTSYCGARYLDIWDV